MESKRIVVIRISGRTGIKKPIKDTLNMLRLYKKHNCVVIPNTQPFLGMLTRVRDTCTWGEIDEKTCKELLTKRGKLAKKKSLTEEYLKEKVKMDISTFTKEYMQFKKDLKDVPGLKLFFKLRPPEGGFERKGIKHPFSLGGVLGYRKDKINDLLMRML